MEYEAIEKIVVGIANRYAKDKVNGYAWDKEKFEEYRQELFLEAYSLLQKQPDVDKNYMAMTLWNRAGEFFYNETKRLVAECYTGMFERSVDEGEWVSNELADVVLEQSLEKLYSEKEDVEVANLVRYILNLVEDQDTDIKKFVIARLKISGYLSVDDYPEVEVTLSDYENANISENYKILRDILNMHGAVSGGTNKFKTAKRQLFLDLISEFDVEDVYRKWFEVRYIDKDGSEKVDKVKKYSAIDATNHFKVLPNVREILTVQLEE